MNTKTGLDRLNSRSARLWIVLSTILIVAVNAAGCSGRNSVTTTDSGLQIEELEVGDGQTAAVGDTVRVHYTGWLEDGTQFDSSVDRGRPFGFTIGEGQVIAGWDEGLVGMKEGGKRRLLIPPDLAYGALGAGEVIPPNATLTFEVELLKIVSVQFEDLVEGTGPAVETGDSISMKYVGWLEDGTQFDSSDANGGPFTFTLGTGRVIRGWDEGIDGMRVGGVRRITIPPEFAFGSRGVDPIIPPDATLIFEVELLKIVQVEIEDLVVGEGDEVVEGDAVVVHYTGWLEDGTKFDSSIDRGQPFQFTLGAGQVIPGWEQGVLGMRVGGSRRLVIPPELAYGQEGAGDVIPPGAKLIFEVMLVDKQ